jgi:elongation factor Ts
LEQHVAATAITADLVKALRERTGAGMMDCKAALAETGGDMEKAVDVLRKRGLAQAAKKSGRATNEGVIHSYIHQGGKVGVLVEVNCESDFVARTEDFQRLVKEIGLQIAAASPLYVSREEAPADVIEREKGIYREQMASSGKPAHVIDKIVEGKLEAYYKQFCLVDQPSIRDPNVTVGEMIKAVIGKLGENVSVARFARFKVGERP